MSGLDGLQASGRNLVGGRRRTLTDKPRKQPLTGPSLD